jgi:CRISPR system Cascade subunit CasD
MTTLLLRFRAPMMSWGDHSRFTIRDTRREPTKSAIIGLLCSALGRSRHESVSDLASLKMGVRVDQEGIVQCDYHTVQNAITSEGKLKPPPKDTLPSHRYYVADADYLIGLEGDVSLLSQLEDAVKFPCWQLYFGRKSFVPSVPVYLNDGMVNLPLLEALKQYSYPQKLKSDQKLRYIIETEDSLDVRSDVPLNWEKRLFGNRCVETCFYSWSEVKECISPN